MLGLYFSVSSIMISGVGRGTRMMLHPLYIALFIISVYPATWKNGSTASSLSVPSSVSKSQVLNCCAVAMEFA